MNQQASWVKHIVLADDNPDHCILFEKLINRIDHGIQLSYAYNGNDLLELIEEKSADFLFLDLRMPGKNGFECLERIRTNSALQHLRIVIYSHSSSMHDIEQAFKYKADFYVVKPFEPHHLQNALQQLLDQEPGIKHRLHRHYFINNRFVRFTTGG